MANRAYAISILWEDKNPICSSKQSTTPELRHMSNAPSTRFYLDDKERGNQWITRLPFPVQCVERVETLDRINGNHFVTRYAYHDGYYDGIEREFRGFGMVEQWDTEEIDILRTRMNHEATN